MRVLIMLVGLGLLGPSFATAQVQRMALPAGRRIAVASGSSQATRAFCLNFDRAFPQRTSRLHTVLTDPGGVVVRTGSRQLPLDQAIQQRLVTVEGTNGYDLLFRNHTNAPIEIEVVRPTVLGDGHTPLDASAQELAARITDRSDQQTLWQDLGQLHPEVSFLVERLPEGRTQIWAREGSHGAIQDLGIHPNADVGDVVVSSFDARLDTSSLRANVVTRGMNIAEAHALLADVRVRGAQRHLRARFRGEDSRPEFGETLLEHHVATANVAQGGIVGTSRLEIPSRLRFVEEGARDVDLVAIVEFNAPPSQNILRRGLQRIRAALQRVVGNLLGSNTRDVSDRVREAVETELNQVSPADATPRRIWLELRDEAERVYIVEITRTGIRLLWA